MLVFRTIIPVTDILYTMYELIPALYHDSNAVFSWYTIIFHCSILGNTAKTKVTNLDISLYKKLFNIFRQNNL